LKNASWVFTLLLGALLFYACTLLPQAENPNASVSMHVSSRFLERGQAETGFSSLEAAILADYRSFDFFLLGFIFFTSALLAVLLHLSENRNLKPSLIGALVGSALGALVLAGVGFYCLKGGSNFLDYEPFTALTKPAWARVGGAALLALGCAFTLSCNLYLMWSALTRRKEAELGN
jgi:multisubunit Na+/H+ antiporter MnhB subunit